MRKWMTAEALGLEAGDVNLFGYVGNSPLFRHDPSGLETYGGNLIYEVPDTPSMSTLISPTKIGGKEFWGYLRAYVTEKTYVAFPDGRRGPENGPGIVIAYGGTNHKLVKFVQLFSTSAKLEFTRKKFNFAEGCLDFIPVYRDVARFVHEHNKHTVIVSDPNKPIWQVDNGGNADPYYAGSTGEHKKKDDTWEQWMGDAPRLSHLAEDLFDNFKDAVRVYITQKFVTYAVAPDEESKIKPFGKVTWTVKLELGRGEDNRADKHVIRVQSVDKVSSFDKEHIGAHPMIK